MFRERDRDEVNKMKDNIEKLGGLLCAIAVNIVESF